MVELPSFSQYNKVNEQLLGNLTKGLALTSAKVGVAPAENPDVAQLSILVNGTTSTDVYVRRLGIKVSSQGQGTISARKELFATLGGLETGPVTASASMTNQFAGISTPNGRIEQIGLVEKFAEKTFNDLQPKANKESERTAANLIKEEFAKKTDEILEVAFDVIDSAAKMMRKLSLDFPPIYIRTTNKRIEAVIKLKSFQGLGAPTEPVRQSAGDFVQLTVHESLINNFLDEHFSGRVFASHEFTGTIKPGQVVILKDYVDKCDSLQPSSKPVPNTAIQFDAGGEGADVLDWVIWLQKVHPLQIEFEDNRARLTIRANRMEVRNIGEEPNIGQSIEKKFQIRVTCKIVDRGGTLHREVDGDPEILFEDGVRPDDADELLKRLPESLIEWTKDDLKTVLDNALPVLERVKALDQKENPDEEVKEERAIMKVIKSLQLGLLEMRDGWLYLGWNVDQGATNLPGISAYEPAETKAPSDTEE